MDSALRQTSANVTKDTLEQTAQTRPVKPLIIVQVMIEINQIETPRCHPRHAIRFWLRIINSLRFWGFDVVGFQNIY